MDHLKRRDGPELNLMRGVISRGDGFGIISRESMVLEISKVRQSSSGYLKRSDCLKLFYERRRSWDIPRDLMVLGISEKTRWCWGYHNRGNASKVLLS